mgnify:FL=1
MPLQKLQFKPGINRETTSYTNEGGWFDCDKVRFRQGMPEKIGGWTRLGSNSFLGSCRALHSWVTRSLNNYLGVGTSQKYYIQEGEAFYDVTPIRSVTDTLKNISVSVNGVEASTAIGSPTVEIDLGSVTGLQMTSAVGNVGVITNQDMTVVIPNAPLTVFGVIGSASFVPDNTTVTIQGLSATSSLGFVVTSTSTSESAIDFSATDGSSTITVSETDHGAVLGDFVTFSGVTGLGGNITADILNQEYKIDSIINDNNYTIIARQVATVNDITIDGQYTPTPVLANSSDTGDGGKTIVATYQINVGIDTSIVGNGWGAGSWGRGTWGSGAEVNVVTDTLRLWTHDNFGEDLVINVHNGGVYYWEAQSLVSQFQRAQALSLLPGAKNPPTIATKILVSDVDRHVIAFGCDSFTNPGVQDPLLIRFSDQENVADWLPTTTNTAGDLLISSGSKIVTAQETRQQILVFTDSSLHAMQFIGAPFTFGINLISENITIAGPQSAVSIEDNVFWMGIDEFYIYTGAVQKLPCTVKDYVFNDFNFEQREKVIASSNSSFSEAWWFYPSANSANIDKYVVYNYQQNVWYYGTLNRTAWIDRGVNSNPLAASTDNYLYTHEIGFDDGSTNPASGINAYIESSQFDIGDGDNFSFVRRVIPDVTFRDSTSPTPTADFTFKARNFPGGNYLQNSTKAIEKTASVPVEQFTQDANIRIRGRSMALKISSAETGVTWRLGSPRIEIRPDGRR